MFNRYSKFLLSEEGKKFSFLLGGSATTLIMFGHVLPHTVLLNEYKKLISLYKKGEIVSLSDALQKRFQKTLDILEVEERDKILYHPFHVYGFDVMSAGMSRSTFGAIIGLPISFAYSSMDTANDKPKILINNEDLHWDTDNGQKLLKSLILSENAQIYAMAHEMKMRQTLKPLYETVAATMLAMLTYSYCNHLNIKAKLYTKPRSARLALYSLVGTVCFTMYCMIKDVTTVFFEKSIDEELMKKNPIFIEGGKEYYTQIVERNKILREVMGTKGKKLYTALGNENSLIRTRHIQVVQRKAIFEEASPEIRLNNV